MRRRLATGLMFVLLALLCIPAPAAPNHVHSAKHGLTALAHGAPVCSLPQAQRRAIVALKAVRLPARAVDVHRLATTRVTRGDVQGPPLPRLRKCPPPRSVAGADPAAPTALLAGAFA